MTDTTQDNETQEQDSNVVAQNALTVIKAGTLDSFIAGFDAWKVPFAVTGQLKAVSLVLHYAIESGVGDSDLVKATGSLIAGSGTTAIVGSILVGSSGLVPLLVGAGASVAFNVLYDAMEQYQIAVRETTQGVMENWNYIESDLLNSVGILDDREAIAYVLQEESVIPDGGFYQTKVDGQDVYYQNVNGTVVEVTETVMQIWQEQAANARMGVEITLTDDNDNSYTLLTDSDGNKHTITHESADGTQKSYDFTEGNPQPELDELGVQVPEGAITAWSKPDGLGEVSMIDRAATGSADGVEYNISELISSIQNAGEKLYEFIETHVGDSVKWLTDGELLNTTMANWFAANLEGLIHGELDFDEAFIDLAEYVASQHAANFVVDSILNVTDAKRALDQALGFEGYEKFLYDDVGNIIGSEYIASKHTASIYEALGRMAIDFALDSQGWDTQQYVKAGLVTVTSVVAANYGKEFFTETLNIDASGGVAAVTTLVSGLLNSGEFDSGDWIMLGVQTGIAYASGVASATVANIAALGSVAGPVGIVVGAVVGIVAAQLIKVLYKGKVFGEGEFGDLQALLDSVYRVETITLEDGSEVQALVAQHPSGSVIRVQEGITHVIGNVGHDNLIGSDNDETFSGHHQSDYIEAQGGDDVLLGGRGHDHLNGGAGDDMLQGGIGYDLLFGEAGADILQGGQGDDFIHGGSGDDVLDGGDGHDVILGAAGNDAVLGGAGDDMIELGAGDDAAEGGDGNDWMSGNLGNDVMDGGDGEDRMDGGDGDDQMHGGAGADVLYGGFGVDIVRGDAGNDVLLGEDGNDFLEGGLGHDGLRGGAGTDMLLGGMDNDVLEGEEGDDALDGGSGDDVLTGGLGNDVSSGGAGDDVFIFARGDGQDVVQDSSGLDVISLLHITPSEVSFTQDGDNMVIGLGINEEGTQDQITIAGQFAGGAIERLEFAEGQWIDLTAVDFSGGTTNFTVHTGDTTARTIAEARSHVMDSYIAAQSMVMQHSALAELAQQAYEEALLAEIDTITYNGSEVETYKKKRGFGGGHYTVYKLKQATELEGNDETELTELTDEEVAGLTETPPLLVSFMPVLDEEAQAMEEELQRMEEEAAAAPQKEGVPDADVELDATDLTATDYGYDAIHLGDRITTTYDHGTDRYQTIDDWIGEEWISTTHMHERSSFYLFRRPPEFRKELAEGTRVWDFDYYAHVEYDIAQVMFGEKIITASDDQIIGGWWAETITGSAGDDILIGNSGDDTLHGGLGDDWVFGGSGHDTVTGGEGADAIFGGSGNDLIEGGEGNDVIFGMDGDDELYGQWGDDFIHAGAGVDYIYGGDGNDVIFAGSGDDEAYGGTGIDVIHGEGGDDLIVGDEGSDFLYGDDGNDTLLGVDDHDKLDGGTGNDLLDGAGGDDLLLGNTGDDVLRADAGNDILDGGDGHDTADYRLAVGAVIGDLAFGTISENSFGFDVIRNVETVLLGSGNDRLHGDVQANRLFGFEGHDRLYGRDGNDSLYAHEGDDKLYGGNGSDKLYGYAGNDTLHGGNDNDRLRGDEGDDILRGEHGHDLLVGDAGNDTLDGGDGIDMASYSLAQDVVTIRLVQGTAESSDMGSDILTGIEQAAGGAGNDRLYGDAQDNALYGNGGNDSLRAGDGNDRLYGGEGTDWLYGYAGNDTLRGDAGNDVLEGGDGNDLLNGESGDDTLNGGNGIDIAWYSTSTASVTVNLTTGIATGTEVGNDTLLSIEKVKGGQADDIITGDTQDNVIDGYHGNDTIHGDAGTDRLYGGEGNDSMHGGSGDDSLRGDAGDDLLRGNAGNDFLNGSDGDDTLIGGTGVDELIGGTGYDVFTFEHLTDSTTTSRDTITDFTQGEDVITLASLGYSTMSDISITHEGNSTIISGTNDNFQLELENIFTLNESDFMFG